MCIEKYAVLTLIYYITQWACYKKASVYGSRVGWTLARRTHTTLIYDRIAK